jgi:hypothetical protein
MALFEKAWQDSKSTPDLRQELAAQIAAVTRKVTWNGKILTYFNLSTKS